MPTGNTFENLEAGAAAASTAATTLANLLVSFENFLKSPEGQQILGEAKDFLKAGEKALEEVVNVAEEGVKDVIGIFHHTHAATPAAPAAAPEHPAT